jgi:hypothetical protein
MMTLKAERHLSRSGRKALCAARQAALLGPPVRLNSWWCQAGSSAAKPPLPHTMQRHIPLMFCPAALLFWYSLLSLAVRYCSTTSSVCYGNKQPCASTSFPIDPCSSAARCSTANHLPAAGIESTRHRSETCRNQKSDVDLSGWPG